ncbi:hypothetical protein HQ865_16130 [Mucilaginibacter mali]|uniref:Uncharacterized protein n=1 Tax=Mucilaginibacter mali TaxID=2740462 RepID=A0A7D4UE48_9SPHI|nr:hypothetical protein [Mucilaginibacter mali]QKJ31219.1 hypothetical protein HQ865_16130 [Mucilaginibacter mali]
MERLMINIPENKSALVKQLLKELGVSFKQEKTEKLSDLKKNLLEVSVWSDDDLKPIEDAKNHFQNLGSEKW